MSSGTLVSEQENLIKRRASAISLAVYLCVTALKVAAALLTGSVSLISESIHSAADVVVSMITFFSVRAAAIPPDENHPYGHGKIESLAGFGESLFLLLTVIYIITESVGRMRHGAAVHRLDIGIAIMAISALASLAVGPYLRRVAKQTESIALMATGKHQMIDFVTSTGVLVALLVMRFTGWQDADAIFAIVLAIWIAGNALVIAREAVQQLIDRRVSDDELEKIHEILRSDKELISYHRLRTRHSGHVHYVDVHVVVPNEWSVVTAHALADRLEKAIATALHPAQAVVHVDPYDPVKALKR